MKKIKHLEWTLFMPPKTEENKAIFHFNNVNSKQYASQEVLKSNHRSHVERIEIEGDDMVYKVPIEKNTWLWIRFLTLFRKGEAHKNLRAMELLAESGIKTTKAIMAAEKRKFGMVVDSWLLYEYLDGKTCLDQPNTYPHVVDTLKKIHECGFSHGDPQIRNFVVKANDIYVIDTNPKKLGLTGFDKAYEWVYLRKSAPGIEKYFGQIQHTFWYKYSIWYDQFDRKLAALRRSLKRLFGLNKT